MGKYTVEENSTVTVDVYIDVSNGVKVVYDSCGLQQGKAPCDGDVTAPCEQKYEKCNCSLKEICGDQYGKLMKENNGVLPETVVKETATWKKDNWSLSTAIETEAWVMNQRTKEKDFDYLKMVNAKIKYQLKSWTLDKDSPSLRLYFTKDMNGLESLRADSIVEIGKIDRDILMALYKKGMEKLSTPITAGSLKNS